MSSRRWPASSNCGFWASSAASVCCSNWTSAAPLGRRRLSRGQDQPFQQGQQFAGRAGLHFAQQRGRFVVALPLDQRRDQQQIGRRLPIGRRIGRSRLAPV